MGLPALISRSKTETFESLKAKIQSKILGWKERLLSHAGKEVLIKAVAFAIHMSCFRLPATFCHSINSLTANFWWRQRDQEKRIHWIAWNKMCKPKLQEGLGYRDLEKFNMALLTKQGWRIISNPNSLMERVLKG